MSESILKNAVEVLATEYPNVEKSTLMVVCKSQFKWALTTKDVSGGLCKEASQALVFVREPEIFIEQMEAIGEKARAQYRASVDAIHDGEQD